MFVSKIVVGFDPTEKNYRASINTNERFYKVTSYGRIPKIPNLAYHWKICAIGEILVGTAVKPQENTLCCHEIIPPSTFVAATVTS